jgi:SSS family solute:Na+ symporter
MAGKGYSLGLAIASYEWMAAITMVIVALVFLPRFLSAGIYTIPEYLEYRFDARARKLMAGYMLAAYLFVALATVLYSGGLAMEVIFGLDRYLAIWLIGLASAALTVVGGLRSVVWADLLLGSGLIVGGALVTYYAITAVGGWNALMTQAESRLHTVLPANHPEMPWVAVFVGGLWIPNLFYWGLNQFITQRTLGAKSLAEGQRGILFAASLKLILPFIIVIPGIAATLLYPPDVLGAADAAFPMLIRNLLPDGLRGLMFAALFGAVVSTINSLLNSSATIFTMDFYRSARPEAPHSQLVRVGRIATAVFLVVSCLYAPVVGAMDSVFSYIQMFWGFVSPGIVAVFVLGLLFPRAPRYSGVVGLVLSVPLYGLQLVLIPEMAFLHAMGITFLAVFLVLAFVAFVRPAHQPASIPESKAGNLQTTASVYALGAAIVAATVSLYILFA